MFTGIVTHRGRIEGVEEAGGEGGVIRLRVRPQEALERVGIGDSIALDGVCLTVTADDAGLLSFDVMPETMRRTTLGERAPGERVNMERALRVGDPLGGHWVQGHVDGLARIDAIEQRGDDVRMVLAVDDALHGGMLAKASVTLDGVSLTMGEVWREDGAEPAGRFSVYLIPHTLAVTGLGERGVGDRLNVEADILGRWIEHHLRRLREDVTGS